MNSLAVADIRDCCSPALAEPLSWIMDQIWMLTTVEVAQMEVHSAGSTIVGVEVEAAAEHVVVAAAVAVSESVFASIPQAKQAEEEIAIATTQWILAQHILKGKLLQLLLLLLLLLQRLKQ